MIDYVDLWCVCFLFTYRTLPTSTTRLSLWTLHTMPSEMIRGSTGSATQCTSTENWEGSPRRERRIVVFVERVTETTRTDLPAGLPGRRTTPSLSVVTGDLLLCYVFLLECYIFSCVDLCVRFQNFICMEEYFTFKSFCSNFQFLQSLNLTIKLFYLALNI